MMNKTTRGLFLSVPLLIALGSITSRLQAQPNPPVLVKSGSGTITCAAAGKNVWTTSLIDLSEYVGGRLVIEIKLGDGECAGSFFLNAPTDPLPPQGRRQTANIGRRFPTGHLRVLLGRGGKIILVGTGNTHDRPGSTNTFEFKAYVVDSRKIAGVPCDDNEIQVDYNNNALSYHSYTVDNEICSTSNPLCNLDLVFSTMISQVNYIAPSDSTSKVTNCMEAAVNLPLLSGVDSIRVSVNPANRSVTNYTRKDHALHPGKVTRTVVEKGGRIYVVTSGEGTGKVPTLNELKAPSVWGRVDKGLIGAVRQKFK